jgi:succinate dehydrogenase / fumarate reductase, cytochrome b subunit
MRVSDSTYYTLRRLHSLTGVVPVGTFLLEHLFTNSLALQGPAKFNEAAATLGSIPYVVLVEILGIGVPILFHMVLGVIIATTMQANLGRHGYPRNWSYVLQRVSGLFLVAYITYHVWSTRLSPEILRGDHDMFGLMQRQLQNPGVLAFYVLGMLAAAYHLGNGLFGFAIHWGIATGKQAQKQAARLGFAVFVVLALVGINSLLAFVGKNVNWFQKSAETTAVRVVETAR